jgi:hypothetical protein
LAFFQPVDGHKWSFCNEWLPVWDGCGTWRTVKWMVIVWIFWVHLESG